MTLILEGQVDVLSMVEGRDNYRVKALKGIVNLDKDTSETVKRDVSNKSNDNKEKGEETEKIKREEKPPKVHEISEKLMKKLNPENRNSYVDKLSVLVYGKMQSAGSVKRYLKDGLSSLRPSILKKISGTIV